MSGSGGSIDVGPRDNMSCANLVFDTQLTSPKANVVAQLNVGSVLTIELDNINQNPLVQAKWNGQVAGGIMSQYLLRIRACLEQGYRYKANVTDIQSGQVRLRVYPA